MRRVAIAALFACLVAGCGSARQETGVVQAWKVEDPYLPPPDPGAGGRTEVPAVGAKVEPDAPDAPAKGAPSDAEVTADLERAYGGRGGTDLDAAAIGGDGLAVIPDTAPRKLVALMHAANDVARKPYVYGGGHGRNAGEIWADSAYDCSGSVSYALAAAGYLKGPEDSGTLMSFGKSGPGK